MNLLLLTRNVFPLEIEACNAAPLFDELHNRWINSHSLTT
jgi:hypothetical protein